MLIKGIVSREVKFLLGKFRLSFLFYSTLLYLPPIRFRCVRIGIRQLWQKLTCFCYNIAPECFHGYFFKIKDNLQIISYLISSIDRRRYSYVIFSCKPHYLKLTRKSNKTNKTKQSVVTPPPHLSTSPFGESPELHAYTHPLKPPSTELSITPAHPFKSPKFYKFYL